jgi:hypothetical protein
MLDRQEAKTLFERYRNNRKGVRKNPGMASICLICGSSDVVVQDAARPHVRHCRSCGFDFLRYECPDCGETLDSRDPETPKCRECGFCRCRCAACSPDCPSGVGADS